MSPLALVILLFVSAMLTTIVSNTSKDEATSFIFGCVSTVMWVLWIHVAIPWFRPLFAGS